MVDRIRLLFDKNMRIKLQSILQPCLIQSFGIFDRITTQYICISHLNVVADTFTSKYQIEIENFYGYF